MMWPWDLVRTMAARESRTVPVRPPMCRCWAIWCSMWAAPTPGGRCRYFHGIYLNNPNDVIQNNIAYGNSGWGITCRHNCSGAVISNNTVFNNGGYGHGNQPASGSPLTCCVSGTNSGVGGGILVGNDSGSQTNTTITNNIVYNNGAADSAAPGFACGIWDFHNNLINSLIANNLVRNDGTGNGAGTPCGDGWARPRRSASAPHRASPSPGP